MTRLAQTQLQQLLPGQQQDAAPAEPPPQAQEAPPGPQPSPQPQPEPAQPPQEPPIDIPRLDLGDIATDVWEDVVLQVEALTNTWALLQLAIILACFALARLISMKATPPLENWLRGIEAQPQLLRVLIIPLRRLTWILFALFLWLAAYLMKEVTWPSRSYYVGIAATLALAGMIISVVSRFIRNRSLATLFFYVAWAVAGLHIVGLLDRTLAALDAAAFSIGAFRLSLLVVLKAVLFLTALTWLATIVGNFVERRLRQNEDVAPALQVLLAKFVKFALLAVAVLATVSAVGIDLTALTVFSGALGLGIGIGLQKVAANIISGVIILSDRSIKPGDVISLGETVGWINSLRSRYVSVITRDGVEYLIPNETFVTEQVINWSHSNQNVRLEIRFGVSYDSDPRQVRQIAGDAVMNLERVLERPAPVCHVVEFGDSSIDFVLRFWIRDPRNGLTNIRGAAFLAIWDAFKEHGIEIPFPHRQLVLPDNVEVTVKQPAKKPARKTARRGSAKS